MKYPKMCGLIMDMLETQLFALGGSVQSFAQWELYHFTLNHWDHWNQVLTLSEVPNLVFVPSLRELARAGKIRVDTDFEDLQALATNRRVCIHREDVEQKHLTVGRVTKG